MPGARVATVTKVPPLPTDPPTSKGRRTQGALVRAAREIFARDGFAGARIGDIASRANVAYGTFYSYFVSKEQILRAVIVELEIELAASRPNADHDTPPAERIADANRQFLRSYRENAALFAMLEQVATLSEPLRELRRDGRELLVERSRRAILHWQEVGLADPDLDARYAANALGNMVDRFAYVWFVLGEEFEEEIAVATLTRLWVQALGLDREPAPAVRLRRTAARAGLRRRALSQPHQPKGTS